MEAKGVFIRAPRGSRSGRSPAGQVVYADWMRGFGNLLIVDHGEGYLSIYANNESLLKQVGDAVAPGEPSPPPERAVATRKRAYTLKCGTWAAPLTRCAGSS